MLTPRDRKVQGEIRKYFFSSNWMGGPAVRIRLGNGPRGDNQSGTGAEEQTGTYCWHTGLEEKAAVRRNEELNGPKQKRMNGMWWER